MFHSYVMRVCVYTHAHIYMKFSSTSFLRAALRLYQPLRLGMYGEKDGSNQWWDGASD